MTCKIIEVNVLVISEMTKVKKDFLLSTVSARKFMIKRITIVRTT